MKIYPNRNFGVKYDNQTVLIVDPGASMTVIDAKTNTLDVIDPIDVNLKLKLANGTPLKVLGNSSYNNNWENWGHIQLFCNKWILLASANRIKVFQKKKNKNDCNLW